MSTPFPIMPLPLNTLYWYTRASIPVGVVVAFAGQLTATTGKNSVWPTSSPCGGPASNPPASPSLPTEPSVEIEALGWMLCDGRSILVSEYPELFAVIGYLYGGQDGSFSIPDYRGLFLRGVDAGAGMDADISQRLLPQGGKGTKDGVGSLQCDALLAHQHSYSSVQSPATPSQEGSAAGAPADTTSLTADPIKPQQYISQAETRPKNIYVNYIIKYREVLS
ncbi:MAG: phage tail protein [Acidobacteriota bacterium]